MIAVGQKLPNATLYEFLNEESEGCSCSDGGGGECGGFWHCVRANAAARAAFQVQNAVGCGRSDEQSRVAQASSRQQKIN